MLQLRSQLPLLLPQPQPSVLLYALLLLHLLALLRLGLDTARTAESNEAVVHVVPLHPQLPVLLLPLS